MNKDFGKLLLFLGFVIGIVFLMFLITIQGIHGVVDKNNFSYAENVSISCIFICIELVIIYYSVKSFKNSF